MGLLKQADGGAPVATKSIFYLNRLVHPVFLEIMRERSDVSLHGLVNASSEAEVAPVLAAANA